MDELFCRTTHLYKECLKRFSKTKEWQDEEEPGKSKIGDQFVLLVQVRMLLITMRSLGKDRNIFQGGPSSIPKEYEALTTRFFDVAKKLGASPGALVGKPLLEAAGIWSRPIPSSDTFTPRDCDLSRLRVDQESGLVNSRIERLRKILGICSTNFDNGLSNPTTLSLQRDEIEGLLAALSSLKDKSPALAASNSQLENGVSGKTTQQPGQKHGACNSCTEEGPCSKLDCGHLYCIACLCSMARINYADALTPFPPTCCKAPFSLELLSGHLTVETMAKYQARVLERAAEKPRYCRSCNAFIRPEDVGSDTKGAYCSRCRKYTCVCGKTPHLGQCTADTTGVQELENLARKKKWQKCYKCAALVGKTGNGCAHIKCRCGAEFCYKCGKKWKNCTSCDVLDQERIMDGVIIGLNGVPRLPRLGALLPEDPPNILPRPQRRMVPEFTPPVPAFPPPNPAVRDPDPARVAAERTVLLERARARVRLFDRQDTDQGMNDNIGQNRFRAERTDLLERTRARVRLFDRQDTDQGMNNNTGQNRFRAEPLRREADPFLAGFLARTDQAPDIQAALDSLNRLGTPGPGDAAAVRRNANPPRVGPQRPLDTPLHTRPIPSTGFPDARWVGGQVTESPLARSPEPPQPNWPIPPPMGFPNARRVGGQFAESSLDRSLAPPPPNSSINMDADVFNLMPGGAEVHAENVSNNVTQQVRDDTPRLFNLTPPRWSQRSATRRENNRAAAANADDLPPQQNGGRGHRVPLARPPLSDAVRPGQDAGNEMTARQRSEMLIQRLMRLQDNIARSPALQQLRATRDSHDRPMSRLDINAPVRNTEELSGRVSDARDRLRQRVNVNAHGLNTIRRSPASEDIVRLLGRQDHDTSPAPNADNRSRPIPEELPAFNVDEPSMPHVRQPPQLEERITNRSNWMPTSAHVGTGTNSHPGLGSDPSQTLTVSTENAPATIVPPPIEVSAQPHTPLRRRERLIAQASPPIVENATSAAPPANQVDIAQREARNARFLARWSPEAAVERSGSSPLVPIRPLQQAEIPERRSPVAPNRLPNLPLVNPFDVHRQNMMAERLNTTPHDEHTTGTPATDDTINVPQNSENILVAQAQVPEATESSPAIVATGPPSVPQTDPGNVAQRLRPSPARPTIQHAFIPPARAAAAHTSESVFERLHNSPVVRGNRTGEWLDVLQSQPRIDEQESIDVGLVGLLNRAMSRWTPNVADTSADQGHQSTAE